MKRIILITLILLPSINSITAQLRLENRNNFFEAESWMLYEEYRDALPLYQQLLRIDPDNANYKYRIGQCYLNISGEKDKAISYLEDAVKNINQRYREGNFNEKSAPPDALFYLGDAYRVNNQLDKAIEAYRLFKRSMNNRIYDSTIVNLQIQSCYNAKELMSKPQYIRMQNLGGAINSSNSEFNPVVSDNEDIIVFMRREAFYDAILYSTKVNGQWTTPQNMNEMLRVDRDLYPTSLSADGKTLYLYSSANYDGDIYTSKFENGKWMPIVKLNSNINTRYWESHASVSHDDQKLYFTSNRGGTHGGLDIYVSTRNSAGDWGVATNLGPVINTPYNEESPFLSKDGKTLFFSSRGHYNMGGYDVFYSKLLDNGTWSEPVNLGYPVNTTDDDVFFKPINDGYVAYYSVNRPDGFGKEDIYRIEIFNDNNPRKFLVNGTVVNSEDDKDAVKISFAKTDDSKIIQQVSSDPTTGRFEVKDLPHGNYNVTFETQDGEKTVRNLNLPIDMESDTIMLSPTIISRGNTAGRPDTETDRNNNTAATEAIADLSIIRPDYSRVISANQIPYFVGTQEEQSTVEKSDLIENSETEEDNDLSLKDEEPQWFIDEKSCKLWALWLGIGVVVLFFMIFFFRRNRKEK